MSDGFEATNTQTRSKHSLSKAGNKVTFKYSITVKRHSEVVGTACKIIESVALLYSTSVCVRVRVHLSPEEESRKSDYSDRSSPLLLLQEQSVL